MLTHFATSSALAGRTTALGRERVDRAVIFVEQKVIRTPDDVILTDDSRQFGDHRVGIVRGTRLTVSDERDRRRGSRHVTTSDFTPSTKALALLSNSS